MTLELGRVTGRRTPFKYAALVRVGFSDTDAQGIVYYGRYMPFFDTARFEYLRHLGLLDVDLPAQQFVMRASNVEYHAPARFDDVLDVYVRVRRVGRSSTTFALAAYGFETDVLLCTCEQTLVLVELAARRPVTIPESYRTVVRDFEGADLEEATA